MEEEKEEGVFDGAMKMLSNMYGVGDAGWSSFVSDLSSKQRLSWLVEGEVDKLQAGRAEVKGGCRWWRDDARQARMRCTVANRS